MTLRLHITSALALITVGAWAQTPDWEWTNPTPTSQSMAAVARLSPTEAFACGQGGQLLHTTDAGATWQIELPQAEGHYSAIQFFGADTGYMGRWLLHLLPHHRWRRNVDPLSIRNGSLGTIHV
ncbi:MAG: hypothetical protein IPI91_17190, partial [Flavobacteriales bacterium]|nr:hypothetical protein [Flavobacteriales bacterium]